MLPWAIIPTAGKGTRLLPETAEVPKVLLPVGSRTMLEWTLREAVAAGVPAVIVVVSPAHPQVRTFVGALRAGAVACQAEAGSQDAPGAWLQGVEIHFVVQPEPMGVGDALIRCRALTGGDAFGVLLPDNWFHAAEPALRQVEAGFRTTGVSAIGLIEVTAEHAGILGNVGGVTLEPLGGHTHRILSLQEKAAGSFEIDGSGATLRGCARYVVGPEFYEALAATGPPDAGEWDDVPAFQRLIAAGGLIGQAIEGRFFDVGQKAGYAAAETYVAELAP